MALLLASSTSTRTAVAGIVDPTATLPSHRQRTFPSSTSLSKDAATTSVRNFHFPLSSSHKSSLPLYTPTHYQLLPTGPDEQHLDYSPLLGGVFGAARYLFHFLSIRFFVNLLSLTNSAGVSWRLGEDGNSGWAWVGPNGKARRRERFRSHNSVYRGSGRLYATTTLCMESSSLCP